MYEHFWPLSDNHFHWVLYNAFSLNTMHITFSILSLDIPVNQLTEWTNVIYHLICLWSGFRTTIGCPTRNGRDIQNIYVKKKGALKPTLIPFKCIRSSKSFIKCPCISRSHSTYSIVLYCLGLMDVQGKRTHTVNSRWKIQYLLLGWNTCIGIVVTINIYVIPQDTKLYYCRVIKSIAYPNRAVLESNT